MDGSDGAITNLEDGYDNCHHEHRPGIRCSPQLYSKIVRRSWKNVVVMGVIFLLIGSAETTMILLQSSVHSKGRMGVLSSSVINLMTVVSSLLLPTVLIDFVGMRGSLGLGILGYMCYVVTNSFGSWGTLIAGGAVQGLVQGPVWTSSSCYIRAVGLERAEITGEDPELIVAKFFSIFFLLYQLCNVPSSLVSSLILSRSDVINGNMSDVADMLSCGKDFCPSDAFMMGNQTHSNIVPPSDMTGYILIGVCCGIAAMGLPLTFLGLDKPCRKVLLEEQEPKKSKLERVKESLLSAVILHKHLKMWLIMPIGIANGVIVTFTAAEWTEAFVGCTLGVSFIGWGLLPYGIACSASSYGSEWLLEKTNRLTVFFIGSTVTCGVSIYFLLWTPREDQLWLFLLLSALWGIGESPLYPLVTSLYGEAFPDQSEGAYANQSAYFGMGATMAYGYSGFLCTNIKIYVLIGTVTFAMLCYIISCVMYREGDKASVAEDKKMLAENEITIN